MKTIKTFCIALLTLTFSCSSDDDNGSPQTQYGQFPTTITKTSVTNPDVNRSFNFTYNNENQITNISIVFPDGEVWRNYHLGYNNGNLTSIVDGDFNYAFGYSSENRLNSIAIDIGSDVITVPVEFNAATNTYIFTLEGTTNFTVNEEATMPISYTTESAETTIGYTTMDGAFKNLEYQIALGIIFGGTQGLDYFFFHPYALQSMFFSNELGSTEWTITNTQDEAGNITQTQAVTPFESYTYSIEYEQREL